MTTTLGKGALQRHLAGPAIDRAIAAALAAIDPARVVAAAITGHGDALRIAGRSLSRDRGETIVIAIGKAAVAMSDALSTSIDEPVAGVVVTKHAPLRPSGLPVILGDHPVPGPRSVQAAKRIEQLLTDRGEHDTVIVLVSGGASALVCAPMPGLTLRDVQATTTTLLRAGADIVEINTVRKKIDRLKGGWLAARAHPAHVIALVLSDVPDDLASDPARVAAPGLSDARSVVATNPTVVDAAARCDVRSVVASGPTVGDRTTFRDALAVLARHGVNVPAAVREHLHAGAAGQRDDNPRPDDPRLARAHTSIVAGNATARAAAIASLRADGYAIVDAPPLRGEAAACGAALAAALRDLTGDRPLAFVSGGETVVHVRGTGHGGRNQQLALAAVDPLADAPAHVLVTFATDGEDGPTDAAGAVVTGTTRERAAALGLHPAAHLRDDDAYPFFAALGDLLRPGPTGTNACDLAIGVYDPRKR